MGGVKPLTICFPLKGTMRGMPGIRLIPECPGMAPSDPARSRSGNKPARYLKRDTGPTTPPWETRRNKKYVQEECLRALLLLFFFFFLHGRLRHDMQDLWAKVSRPAPRFACGVK